jgi:[acyl-carrier-protein] S-malonyltransferase
VIAGHAGAVQRASERCKAAGAKKVVPLPVSAPFHCALMAPAEKGLAPILATLPFPDPSIPLINNVDASPVRTGAECRDGLLRQVCAPVRWQAAVERLAGEGVTTFVEVGPGTVLSGLIRKIAKDATVLNVEDPQSLEKTCIALGANPERPA